MYLKYMFSNSLYLPTTRLLTACVSNSLWIHFLLSAVHHSQLRAVTEIGGLSGERSMYYQHSQYLSIQHESFLLQRNTHMAADNTVFNNSLEVKEVAGRAVVLTCLPGCSCL